LTVDRASSSLKLKVSDSGRGIDPDFLPHVFERFQQASGATTRTYGGLGLGLAICQHIVELHGGRIEAESKGEGHGATFTVLLPISAVRDATLARPRLDSMVGAQAFELRPELKGLRVLVVDDEHDARDLVTEILQTCGAIVCSAGSAAEAMERLRTERPEVLVSDIGMPDEDGYSLIRKIRALDAKDGGNIPAAALTAYARGEDRRKALDAGFMMHIPKPVEPAELVAVIASLTRFGLRR
jgi:CheY-like chemotaxis protein